MHVVSYHDGIAVQYSSTLSWYALLMLSTVVSSREKIRIISLSQ